MNIRKYIITAALTMAMMHANAQEVFLSYSDRETETQPLALQLHTNGIYLLAGIVNIGAEVQTDWGVSLLVDYAGAWWNKRSSDRFYSCYGLQAELRYYPDAIKNYAPYRAHHFGIYGQMLTYDFEFGWTGYQCPNLLDTYAFGVAYGYTKVLNRRLSIDFTVGIGYFRTKYAKYQPYGEHQYMKILTSKSSFFGPTRLEVSLVWNINMYNE